MPDEPLDDLRAFPGQGETVILLGLDPGIGNATKQRRESHILSQSKPEKL
jgi:hypothetical protein